jgi:quercetin dioxygenase-like cupin family protein
MLKIKINDQPEVEAFPGVKRRTLACGKDILMARFEYQKGAKVPLHKHAYEQVTAILEGEQRIIIKTGEGIEDIVVKSGEAYFVPANCEHEQIVLRDSVTIDAWSISL